MNAREIRLAFDTATASRPRFGGYAGEHLATTIAVDVAQALHSGGRGRGEYLDAGYGAGGVAGY